MSTPQPSSSSGARKKRSRDGSSVLPMSTPPNVAEPTSNNILEASYKEANEKLLRLEEELDFLLHSARSLREQRAKLTEGRVKYLEDGTTSFDDADQLLEDYLKLTAKGKAVEDVIKTLKEECAASRSECDHIHSKLRTPNAKLRQSLRHRAGLAEGRPESGFFDRKAIVDRAIHAESTATSTAGVVGAFGAGITYTTLFSAARGRLDLISWAFTCFLIVVIDCTALQLFALPYHGQLTRIIRSEFPGSMESRLLIYMMLVGVPLVAGFIFLGISVATINNQGIRPIPGSRMAIQAAGFLPVAMLGYFAISIVVVALGALAIRLLRLCPGAKDLHPGDVRLPASVLYPLQEKLHFLPGGPGYNNYRKKHLARKEPAAAASAPRGIQPRSWLRYWTFLVDLDIWRLPLRPVRREAESSSQEAGPGN
ncbi:hypothetical protein JB92DRAFT_3131087 [Gautieria morchelliformis]|nr:hypothetical protein JB92DRAFT_3131087 [Gautieria morchelliformis]